MELKKLNNCFHIGQFLFLWDVLWLPQEGRELKGLANGRVWLVDVKLLAIPY
jgi:hypothetical protein